MADYKGKWLQDPQMISFEVSDLVATNTLHRPDKRNSLSPALLAERRDAMIYVARDIIGAKTLQRLAGEGDARVDLSKGPRRTKFALCGMAR